MHVKGYLLLTILLGIFMYSTFAEESGSASGGNVKDPGESKYKGSQDYFDTRIPITWLGLNGQYPMYMPTQSPVPPLTYYQYLQAIAWAKMQAANTKKSPNLPTLYPSNPFLKSTQCHGLIDAEYPIFSDMCGAVPQARYILPNTFGHTERWVLAHILTSLMSASTDQTCTRSLRVLLCPMLFQPCQRQYEGSLVLPCQAFCRAVKSQCKSSALDVIPCELLPFSSDLCPVNQPFNPFLTPTNTPVFDQPSVPGQTAPSNPQTSRHYGFTSPQGNVQSNAGISKQSQPNHASSTVGKTDNMQTHVPSRAEMINFREVSRIVPDVPKMVQASPSPISIPPGVRP